jgi:hypothetical protein
VVIDFEETEAAGWRGSVQADRGIGGLVPFEGRLELLRFLEELLTTSPNDPPEEHTP